MNQTIGCSRQLLKFSTLFFIVKSTNLLNFLANFNLSNPLFKNSSDNSNIDEQKTVKSLHILHYKRNI